MFGNLLIAVPASGVCGSQRQAFSSTLRTATLTPWSTPAVMDRYGTWPTTRISIGLIESTFAAGKPIALVCHAPAALRKTRSAGGAPLVKGSMKSCAYASRAKINQRLRWPASWFASSGASLPGAIPSIHAKDTVHNLRAEFRALPDSRDQVQPSPANLINETVIVPEKSPARTRATSTHGCLGPSESKLITARGNLPHTTPNSCPSTAPLHRNGLIWRRRRYMSPSFLTVRHRVRRTACLSLNCLQALPVPRQGWLRRLRPLPSRRTGNWPAGPCP